jgi:hypothetical protein
VKPELVMRVSFVAVAIVLTFGMATGCRKPPPPREMEDAAPPPPKDHLAEGEVPEGSEKAFALPLPRAARVSVRFRDSVHVQSATLGPEQMANFVRARVKSGKVMIGTTMTTFEDVVVPAEPKRHITVEVRRGPPMSGARSVMVVTDVTPPPPPDPNESEADRRKKSGLSPDGTKLIDPNHMQ